MNFTAEQMDALKELFNIGVGRAADLLNQMIQSHISLQVPCIKIITSRETKNGLSGLNSDKNAAVRLGFKGSLVGAASLVFPTESASKLVDAFTGEDFETPDLDSVRIGTLTEVGNIVINGVMGSISNMLSKHISYSVPSYSEGSIQNVLLSRESVADIEIIMAQTRFTIEQLRIEGDILLVFEVGSFDELLAVTELTT